MAVRDTVMASSINFAGATLRVLKLLKRSMISAKAKVEQATRGHIGQPAACMIENNRALSKVLRWRRGDFGTRDYGPKHPLSRTCDARFAAAHPPARGTMLESGQASTATVDNFVGNRVWFAAKGRICWAWNTLLKV